MKCSQCTEEIFPYSGGGQVCRYCYRDAQDRISELEAHAEDIRERTRLLWLAWVNKKTGFAIRFQDLMISVGLDYRKL